MTASSDPINEHSTIAGTVQNDEEATTEKIHLHSIVIRLR